MQTAPLMVARLYSFATLSDEDEPTRKAPIFIAAYARDFEEDVVTDVRHVPPQTDTLPMARPPVRGPDPAYEPAPNLHQSVRCLTPASLSRSLGPFRAEAANEQTLATDEPRATPRRAHVCRGVVASVVAAASLVALVALGMQAPRVVDGAPHVPVVEAASLSHDVHAKRSAPPSRQRVVLGSAAPLPVPVARHGPLVRTAPF